MDRVIVAGIGVQPAPFFGFQGILGGKLGNTPPYELITDNLDTQLDNPVDRYRGNASGSILERFIKIRASKMFGHPE